MRSKISLPILCLVSLICVGGVFAAAQRTARHNSHLYVGKTQVGTPVKIRIEFDYGDPSAGRLNNSTWIDWVRIFTPTSPTGPTCKGQGPWGWSGGERVRNQRFSYKYSPSWSGKNGNVDMFVIHGQVSSWDKARLSWRKVTGTVRLVAASAAYTDSYGVTHPATSCDVTYRWAAARRG